MITPNYKSKQEAAITVILDTRVEHDPVHFRCSLCGNIVFEYTSPLAIISAGTPETLKTPTIVQCPHSLRVPRDDGTFNFIRCKTRYYVIK